jgi:NAD-dependent dihydropyrimidine dehydrogenase PreA subunit
MTRPVHEETHHGVFIEVDVDDAIARDPEIGPKLDEVCPVDIFSFDGSVVAIVDENLDECVLCELCIEAAPPGTVVVRKLYDGGQLRR